MQDTSNLKIIDCTFRDGGHLNNWNFDKRLVKGTYKASSLCGTDYFEVGYISSKKYFNDNKFGIWRFSSEENIKDITKGITGAKISVMIDYNKIDYKDIPQYKDTIISTIRIATYVEDLRNAIDLGEKLISEGYEIFLNLMAIAAYSKPQLINALKMLYHSRIENIVIADSFGSLMPNDVSKIINIFKLTEKNIGFHAHNNLQMAFANSCAAIENGVTFIDASVYGLGRAAGNLPLELLISYLSNIDKTKYTLMPILELINDSFIKLKEELNWGYSFEYMLTGTTSIHPNYAQEFMHSDGNLDIEYIWNAMNKINRITDTSTIDKNLIKSKATTINKKSEYKLIDVSHNFKDEITKVKDTMEG